MKNRIIRNHIREIRKTHGLSQKELAGLSGVSVQSIINLENKNIVPREKTIKSLAKALKSKEDKLFEYIENKSKPQKVVSVIKKNQNGTDKMSQLKEIVSKLCNAFEISFEELSKEFMNLKSIVKTEKNMLKPRAKRNDKQRAEKMPDDLIQSMKNLRISRGLSQKSLAQEMGGSQSTIAFLEQGRMKISENLKNRIIAYLEN